MGEFVPILDIDEVKVSATDKSVLTFEAMKSLEPSSIFNVKWFNVLLPDTPVPNVLSK